MGRRVVVLALVVAAGLGWARAAHADTYTVCGYSYSAGGSQPDNCMSLPTAISDAVASQGADTINMLPGDYCPFDIEQNLNSPVTFKGVGEQAMTADAISSLSGPEAGITTIKWDGTFCGDVAPSTLVKLNTFVSSGDIVFQNLELDASGTQYGLYAVGNDANVLLRDVVVTGAGTAGVQYTTGYSAYVDYGIDIDHSYIAGNDYGVIVSGFGSIYATTVASNTYGVSASGGELSLGSATVTGNTLGVEVSGNAQAVASIIAGNTSDCAGNIESQFSQDNLIGSCTSYDGNDITYDAGQGAIPAAGLNGGPTPSILPPAQAQGTGGNLCGINGTDQREALITGTCDIGAADLSSTTAASALPSGDVDLGTVGTGQPKNTTVYLYNGGGDILGVSGVDVSGTGWTITNNNCVYPLITHDGNCSVSLQFSDATVGTYPGSLTFHTTAGDSAVSLTATTVATPAVSFDQGTLTFATTNAGSTTAGQIVTLTNTGQAALDITRVALGGDAASDYTFTTTCGDTVAAGSHCTATVKFAPKLAGARYAELDFTTNAPDSPEAVMLQGTANGTTVQVSTTSLSFADTLVGKSSAPKTITLKNTGMLPLFLTSADFVGSGGEDAPTNAAPILSDPPDWAAANHCNVKIAPHATCTITVTFQPTQTGDLPNTLELTDDASSSPQDIQVDGTGIQGDLTLTTDSLTFDDTLIHQKSDPQTVTLGNDGTAPITLTYIKLSGVGGPGQFTLKSTCGHSLAVGGSCDLTVRFAPNKAGTFTPEVAIDDNAANNPHAISLSGTALPLPTATSTPGTVTFSAPSGTTTDPQTVTLTNTSTTTPLNVASVTLVDSGAAKFHILDDLCTGQTVAPGDTCTVSVEFSAPARKGLVTAHVKFTDDASSPQKSLLKGTST